MSEIEIYKSSENNIELQVNFENDTVWLAQEQLVLLFKRDQSVISRHIKNVFKEGELEEKSNMQKMHIANSVKSVTFYNLDVIISVGYRVKSKQGPNSEFGLTALREWDIFQPPIELQNLFADHIEKNRNPKAIGTGNYSQSWQLFQSLKDSFR